MARTLCGQMMLRNKSSSLSSRTVVARAAKQADESAVQPRPRKAATSLVRSERAAGLSMAERRSRRTTRGNLAVQGKYVKEMEELGAYTDSTRSEINYGGPGKGEVHWYCLWVTSKREESTGQDLVRSLSELPPVRNGAGELVPREVTHWAPQKKVSKWSMRTQRATKQLVRYGPGGTGGWLFLRLIMDDAAHHRILSHPRVRSFRQESSVEVTLPQKLGGGSVRVPKPLSEEFVDEVREWEQKDEVLNLPAVQAEIYGAGGGPLTSFNEKIDDNAEFLEVGPGGGKRYKTNEYSGDYSNPSRWFDEDQATPEPAAEATGTGPGKRASSKPTASAAKTRSDWWDDADANSGKDLTTRTSVARGREDIKARRADDKARDSWRGGDEWDTFTDGGRQRAGASDAAGSYWEGFGDLADTPAFGKGAGEGARERPGDKGGPVWAPLDDDNDLFAANFVLPEDEGMGAGRGKRSKDRKTRGRPGDAARRDASDSGFDGWSSFSFSDVMSSSRAAKSEAASDKKGRSGRASQRAPKQAAFDDEDSSVWQEWWGDVDGDGASDRGAQGSSRPNDAAGARGRADDELDNIWQEGWDQRPREDGGKQRGGSVDRLDFFDDAAGSRLIGDDEIDNIWQEGWDQRPRDGGKPRGESVDDAASRRRADAGFGGDFDSWSDNTVQDFWGSNLYGSSAEKSTPRDSQGGRSAGASSSQSLWYEAPSQDRREDSTARSRGRTPADAQEAGGSLWDGELNDDKFFDSLWSASTGGASQGSSPGGQGVRDDEDWAGTTPSRGGASNRSRVPSTRGRGPGKRTSTPGTRARQADGTAGFMADF